MCVMDCGHDLKSMDKIKELPDNSCDIESDNIMKRYQQRPKQLENLCLADFVAWYNCKSEGNDHIKAKPNSSLADVYLEERSEKDEYEMKGGITLIKRQKPRIIRSVIFNKNREQIMLYTAWRNETTDLSDLPRSV